MTSGSGGGSAPDYAAVAASNERIYDKTVESARPWTEAGETALPQIMYEFGLGPQPYRTREGDIIFANEDGTFSSGQTQQAGGENEFSKKLEGMRGWEAGSDAGYGEVQGIGDFYVNPDTGERVKADDYRSQMKDLGLESRLFDLENGGSSSGVSANGNQSQMSSLPEGATPLGGYTKRPGYDARLQEGNRSIMSAMNAAGAGKDSGSTYSAMARFGQDYATNDYGNYLNGLGQIAGYGQFGVSTAANAGAQLQQSNLSIAGMQQSAYDAQQARNASSMAGIGQLAGTVIGGIGGFAVGGPAGAMAGAQLGGGAGGAVFS